MNYIQGLLVVALAATCFAFIVQAEPTGRDVCDDMAFMPKNDSERDSFDVRCDRACTAMGWRHVLGANVHYDRAVRKLKCCCAYIEGSEEWIAKQKGEKVEKKKGFWNFRKTN